MMPMSPPLNLLQISPKTGHCFAPTATTVTDHVTRCHSNTVLPVSFTISLIACLLAAIGCSTSLFVTLYNRFAGSVNERGKPKRKHKIVPALDLQATPAADAEDQGLTARIMGGVIFWRAWGIDGGDGGRGWSRNYECWHAVGGRSLVIRLS